jgi:guanylate kinase
VDKSTFRGEIAKGTFLEQAQVSGIKDTFYYGTSVDSVREVAATGRICLLSLDEQGAAQLRANMKIDGLYLFISPPTEAVLEERVRGRLTEAASTIEKRLAWAREQMEHALKPAAPFDHVVQNTEWAAVYLAIKEAISTLSPIIRNRLRGLPAYVLDYSDLIAPNLVEKPFLKPVVIAGPTTTERTALMEELVREFPDVFAFPRLTTTRRPDEVGRGVPRRGKVQGRG